jgi:hypothetical protein
LEKINTNQIIPQKNIIKYTLKYFNK